MGSVDDRIVAMKFDNKHFESNMKDTLRSLEKLKQSLNFDGQKRSMAELSGAAKKFDMKDMGNAAEGVSAKFIALSAVAIAALASIAMKAIEVGGQMLNALTFAPIAEGFAEFELKMGSIQTIMAGSGASLETVNQKLKELNEYSDKTIYSFRDMTSNIGKFTNAGVSLDKSVAAIQGVANVAALSGATSEEASRAMYNFSQALAAGSVKAIDWRSIELANMGTVEFKQQLIDSAEAMGTLTKQGDGWVTSTGTLVTSTKGFRESLADGWLTADALTETLGRYSDATTDIGARATKAATEVKTFSHMMGAMRESVASGWAETFEIVIGDFEEGKKLWTDINEAFNKTVGAAADARNKLLNDWDKMGGRTLLIESLKNALKGIGSILAPIKEAFRDIFPKRTAADLMSMTESFAKFAENLKIGGETASRIKSIFSGFFAVIEIGWEILKGIVGFIGSLISSLSGAGQGMLGVAASGGDMLTELNRVLVDGGGITRFFEKLAEVVRKPIEFLADLTDKVVSFFRDGFSGSPAAEGALGRLEQRFDSFSDVVDSFKRSWQELVPTLEGAWAKVKSWFSSFGDRLGEVLKPGDFDAAVDVINVGLLGGIALMLRKFISGGLKLDFGGGIMEKIGGALDQLTGTLASMQAKVKSDILMKIAIAVGVLAASMLILSTIDSGALAIALGAMAVGFGQLVSVMTVLSLLTAGPLGAAKIAGLAASLILLSSAMLIFSVAIKNLSSLGWGELARGLVGVAGGLTVLVVGLQYLTTNTAGLITAGIAMGVISAALWVLSKAVMSFATMSWAELAKGLAGIAGGLAILVIAMQRIPTAGMLASAVAIGIISASLLVLAQAVQAFANIKFGDTVEGLLGIGAALLLVGAAMKAFPPHMVATAAGLLMVGAALVVIAKAVEIMSSMSLGDLAKGLGALAVTLTLLAAAMILMTGTAAGAAAMLVAAAALAVMTTVLWGLGQLGIGQIVAGLAALAGVFLILGAAALFIGPLAPALLALGVALAVIGGAFALFGVGATLVAKAFTAIAKAGQAAVGVVIGTLKMLAAALPEILGAFLGALMELNAEFLAAGEMIVRLFVALLGTLLEGIVTLAPQIAAAVGAIVTAILTFLRENFPQFLATGIQLLTQLLIGVGTAIPQIVPLVIRVIATFVQTLIANMFQLVDMGVRLLVAFLNAIASRIGQVVTAATNVVIALATGIANNIHRVITVATNIVTSFIRAIGNKAGDIVRAGADTLIRVVEGIGRESGRVVTAAVDVIIKFGQTLSREAVRLADAAFDILTTFLNELAAVIRRRSGELRSAGGNIVGAILDGMTGGLASKAGGVIGSIVGVATDGLAAAKSKLGIQSPSKEFFKVGAAMMQGWLNAIRGDHRAEVAVVAEAERIISAFQATLNQIPDSIDKMGDFHPVITPVLDMTRVQRDSRQLAGILSARPLSAEVSYNQASLIARSTDVSSEEPAAPVHTGPTEIKFEQHNHSPKALSTNDIYRNTRSQIALAKEELKIP